MNRLMQYLGVVGLAWSVALTPAMAASHKNKTSSAATRPSSKTGTTSTTKTKTASEPRTKTKTSGTSTTRSKKAPSGVPARSSAACKVIKSRSGKTRRVCGASAAAEPVLQSPISGNVLDASAPSDKVPEVKARSAPEHAYAVDGRTFFYLGRKYRIAGLKGADGSDMAKQRLQQTLENGNLSIDPVNSDEAGVVTATVRINGQDIADQLR